MQKDGRKTRVKLNIASLLATIIFGLWPVLRTARTNVGVYIGIDKIAITLLYNVLMPGLALISFFTVMLLATTVKSTPQRQTIIQIAMSVLIGCMISLFFLHDFNFMINRENR